MREVLHRVWNSAEGRRGLRALWHVLLGIALLALVAFLEHKGNGWRHAAMRGDSDARRLRAIVAQTLHHHDAPSLLEHAMTGFGAALLGAMVLQGFYVRLVLENGQPVKHLGHVGWGAVLIGAAFVGASVGSVMYPHTGVMVGVFVTAATLVPFAMPNRWRRLAWKAPQWIIGWAGGGFWFAGEIAWKIYHAPVTRDPPEIVAAQLVAGLVALVATSWAVGKLTRSSRSLSPVPSGGLRRAHDT